MEGWVPIKENTEIKIFKKTVEDSNIQCLKGVVDFEFDAKKILLVLRNASNMKFWDPLLQESNPAFPSEVPPLHYYRTPRRGLSPVGSPSSEIR